MKKIVSFVSGLCICSSCFGVDLFVPSMKGFNFPTVSDIKGIVKSIEKKPVVKKIGKKARKVKKAIERSRKIQSALKASAVIAGGALAYRYFGKNPVSNTFNGTTPTHWYQFGKHLEAPVISAAAPYAIATGSIIAGTLGVAALVRHFGIFKHSSDKPKTAASAKMEWKLDGTEDIESYDFSSVGNLNVSRSANGEITDDLIKNLDTILSKCTSLKYLKLSDIGLNKLPSKISELTNLEVLRLEDNQLTELPKEIEKLRNLKSLDLSYNQLKEIPKEIATLQNLKRLDLSGNQLTKIPEKICNLSNLESLGLSDNQLTELPEEIANLQNLELLDLLCNQLTKLPEKIYNLSNLKSLGLSNNQLKEIPEKICNLSNLESLGLSDNQLTELPEEIANLQNLETLSFSNNQLKEIPEKICNLSNLKSLDLSNNQLKEIPKEIATLRNLKMLDLESNKLTELPEEIANLQNLKGLYLSNNQLRELPEEIANLQNLGTLSFSNNQLTELPKWLSELACRGVNIPFYGNPIKSASAATPETVKQPEEELITDDAKDYEIINSGMYGFSPLSSNSTDENLLSSAGWPGSAPFEAPEYRTFKLWDTLKIKQPEEEHAKDYEIITSSMYGFSPLSSNSTGKNLHSGAGWPGTVSESAPEEIIQARPIEICKVVDSSKRIESTQNQTSMSDPGDQSKDNGEQIKKLMENYELIKNSYNNESSNLKDNSRERSRSEPTFEEGPQQNGLRKNKSEGNLASRTRSKQIRQKENKKIKEAINKVLKENNRIREDWRIQQEVNSEWKLRDWVNSDNFKNLGGAEQLEKIRTDNNLEFSRFVDLLRNCIEQNPK